VNFKEIAKRCESGPLMEPKDFLMKSVATQAMKLSKKYEITWDGKTFVNLDDDMADRCFQAGRELFINTGLFSMNTNRLVEVSEDEVDDALKSVRPQIHMGAGKDRVTIHHRQVEDERKPFTFCGPFNANVHEEMFVRLNEVFSREKIADCLFFPGYLNEVDGQLIRPTSALATQMAILYGRWAREAVQRAGRPDMPIAAHAVMAPGEIACTNEEWGLRSTDPRAMVLISELQVDDVTMTRLAYYRAIGCPIYMAFTPLVGGYGGGLPGTSIVAVASFIASIVLGGEIVHIGPQHMKYKQQTNQHSLFLSSLANQAIARNSNIISTTSHTTSGRPGSAQYAREFSALALTSVTSGSNVSGPRPAEPLGNNNVSPLMGKLFCEVAHAAASMTREAVTPIVEALYDTYKDHLELENAPKGQPFEELYDLTTLTPTAEHQAVYDQVKEELIKLGVPLV